MSAKCGMSSLLIMSPSLSGYLVSSLLDHLTYSR